MVPVAAVQLIQTWKKNKGEEATGVRKGGQSPGTYLQVTVDHVHLVAVEHGLQDLLDAVAACKQQGALG